MARNCRGTTINPARLDLFQKSRRFPTSPPSRARSPPPLHHYHLRPDHRYPRGFYKEMFHCPHGAKKCKSYPSFTRALVHYSISPILLFSPLPSLGEWLFVFKRFSLSPIILSCLHVIIMT